MKAAALPDLARMADKLDLAGQYRLFPGPCRSRLPDSDSGPGLALDGAVINQALLDRSNRCAAATGQESFGRYIYALYVDRFDSYYRPSSR